MNRREAKKLAVWAAEERVEFRIGDHGAGPPPGWRAGMGIWLMRDRVEIMNALVNVRYAQARVFTF